MDLEYRAELVYNDSGASNLGTKLNTVGTGLADISLIFLHITCVLMFSVFYIGEELWCISSFPFGDSIP